MILTPVDVSAWRDSANCRGKNDILFGDDTRAAKRVCRGCPVARECLLYAVDHDYDFGVWGGKTFEERQRVCPICLESKHPVKLGCDDGHSLLRMARLILQEEAGDPTVSMASRGTISPATSAGCVIPRGRSHSTAKAYRVGCRCQPARLAFYKSLQGAGNTEAQHFDSVEERFMSHVDKIDGHWMWRGGVNGTGFGNFWNGGRTVRAHLFAYNQWVAPLRKGEKLTRIDECNTRLCVNPIHFKVA